MDSSKWNLRQYAIGAIGIVTASNMQMGIVMTCLWTWFLCWLLCPVLATRVEPEKQVELPWEHKKVEMK